ncbi:hypothetical protein LZ554_009203 [Drepanopeziza brunnea f. sp. 'monogermtubi']|nr:hypothetical protein LZ554_009203 [Drepanopeziza brunnea f. sp. 'monogermtubi']
MGSVQRTIPPGERLLPVQVDELARDHPDKIGASIPKTLDLKDGYRDITYREIARAINRAAGWLEGHFGRNTTEFESLVYLGPFDIRYFILLIAVTKVGFKLLLPSPRNSLEGQLDLFKATECKALLTSSGYTISKDLVQKSGLSPICVPEIDQLLAEGEVKEYPFTKTFDEARLDPFCILHTSGSTGLPKPIVLRHGWATVLDAQGGSPPLNGYRSLWRQVQGKRLFSALPPFHAAGIIAGLLMPLYYDVATIWAPANRPLSAVLVEEVLDATKVEILYSAPTIIEELIQSPASFEKLKKLSAVGYGGAPLDPKLGDQLSREVKIINTMGSTESSSSPLYDTDAEDWAYSHYSPEQLGIEFRPRGDGSYEQVYVRHPSTDQYIAAWSTFPDRTEFPTQDLYTKHPTKPNLWKYMGRIDDTIVLSNGEKFNSVDLEAALKQHPGVKGVLVVGQARFCPAAIVELQDDLAKTLSSKDKVHFLETELWPYAVEANERAPSHGQLGMEKIIFTDPAKPFPRAGKGTIQKGAALKLYASEIDALYQRSDEDQIPAQNLPKIDVRDPSQDLEAKLASVIETVFSSHRLSSDEDFFSAGMDSLHVMGLVKSLKATIIGIPHTEINTRLVYSHPTLRALSQALQQGTASRDQDGNELAAKSREQIMEETLNRAIQKLPSVKTAETVLLTGSTGSLGSYLLHTLIVSPRVSKIYCINRRKDAEQQQASTNAQRGLTSEWGDKVVFLHADLSQDLLGLSSDVYIKLKSEVTSIIHNQWRVDFNLALSSFEPQIAGTLNLIKLAACARSAQILFTSSIGTLGHWLAHHPDTPVPEAALSDPRIPLDQGYSESKWICERLLDAAGAQSGVRSAILRVGQISGPVQYGLGGVWSKAEWLPSIIASSKHLGLLPTSLGAQDSIAWIPVDLLAQIIVELLLSSSPISSPTPTTTATTATTTSSSTPLTRYFNLTNPHPKTWSSLLPTIQSFYAPTHPLQPVPFTEWVQRLADSAAATTSDSDAKAVERNPAVKLLDFYRDASEVQAEGKNDAERKKNGNGNGIATMQTANAERESATMSRLGAVGPEWMRLWLEGWAF